MGNGSLDGGIFLMIIRVALLLEVSVQFIGIIGFLKMQI